MLGQLMWHEEIGHKVLLHRARLQDLPVLQAQLSHDRWGAQGRLKKSGETAAPPRGQACTGPRGLCRLGASEQLRAVAGGPPSNATGESG